MPETARCFLEDARVRPEKRAALEELIRFLYGRRTLAHLGTWAQIRHGVEIVRTLRARSAVYRTMSTESDGPFLFALGFFRVTDGRLEPVADVLPHAEPEALARFLSEFLAPGARLCFEHAGGAVAGWQVEGVGEIMPLNTEAPACAENT